MSESERVIPKADLPFKITGALSRLIKSLIGVAREQCKLLQIGYISEKDAMLVLEDLAWNTRGSHDSRYTLYSSVLPFFGLNRKN